MCWSNEKCSIIFFEDQFIRRSKSLVINSNWRICLSILFQWQILFSTNSTNMWSFIYFGSDPINSFTIWWSRFFFLRSIDHTFLFIFILISISFRIWWKFSSIELVSTCSNFHWNCRILSWFIVLSRDQWSSLLMSIDFAIFWFWSQLWSQSSFDVFFLIRNSIEFV